MRQIATFTLMTLLLAVPFTSAAQKSREEADHYFLLATKKTATMQKELDDAADRGYRILTGSPTSGTEMALFLELLAKPPDTYRYKLLATTRTGTMQKELNDAAVGGYRLMMSTMIAKKSLIGTVEIVALMERPPQVEKQYEYKLLATTKTSTLQKEVTEARDSGFVIAGMVSRDEHMVVMEKESPFRK